MIIPTVGRVVLFHPAMRGYPGEAVRTLPAIVCYVHNERLVNLACFDENGQPFAKSSVPLMQPEDSAMMSGYCEWMPYQKSVASGEIPPTIHAQNEAKR